MTSNILQRQVYADTLRLALEVGGTVLKALISLELDTTETKTTLQLLRTELSNFDVYQQQMVYRCSKCNEIECVCYVVQPMKTEDQTFEERAAKLF